jgi:hypothetical protein
MPVARSTDPDTSWEAAASVDGAVSLNQLKESILQHLLLSTPVTDQQLHSMIEKSFGRVFSDSTVRTRRRELQDLGHVVVVDKKGFTKAGRACQRFTHRDLTTGNTPQVLVDGVNPRGGYKALYSALLAKHDTLVNDLGELQTDLMLAVKARVAPTWVLLEVECLLQDADIPFELHDSVDG